MAVLNDAKAVGKQYANADGLKIRMLLHQKYSINKQPFGDWIMEHYHIQPGMKVLELGCGTGSMWADASRWLPGDAQLLLTDFSAGMLETARGNVPAQPNIAYAQVDIQQIPYEDDSFDLVIANMMLYHVPDLDKALGEVARVLKPEGRFLCATSGKNGIGDWLSEVLGMGKTFAIPFTMQSGGAILGTHFGHVEANMRTDGLEVTDVNDLAAYARSMTSFGGLNDWSDEALAERLNQYAVDGVIRIPKEYGLFQCMNPGKE